MVSFKFVGLVNYRFSLPKSGVRCTAKSSNTEEYSALHPPPRCGGFHRPSDLIRLAGGCAAGNGDRPRFLGRGFVEMTWGTNTGVSTGILKSNVDTRMSRRRFSSTAERTLYHLKRRSGLMRKPRQRQANARWRSPCAKRVLLPSDWQ